MINVRMVNKPPYCSNALRMYRVGQRTDHI